MAVVFYESINKEYFQPPRSWHRSLLRRVKRQAIGSFTVYRTFIRTARDAIGTRKRPDIGELADTPKYFVSTQTTDNTRHIPIQETYLRGNYVHNRTLLPDSHNAKVKGNITEHGHLKVSNIFDGRVSLSRGFVVITTARDDDPTRSKITVMSLDSVRVGPEMASQA